MRKKISNQSSPNRPRSPLLGPHNGSVDKNKNEKKEEEDKNTKENETSLLFINIEKPEASLSVVETFYQQIDLDFLATAED